MQDDTRYDDLFAPGYGVRIGDLRGVQKGGIEGDVLYPRIKLVQNDNHIVISSIYCFPPSRELDAYYDIFRNSEAKRLRQTSTPQQTAKEEKLNKIDFMRKYRNEHPIGNNNPSDYITELYDAMINAGYNIERHNIASNYKN
jgi:hypothetical protein